MRSAFAAGERVRLNERRAPTIAVAASSRGPERFRSAADLLGCLGVTDPRHLDVEAAAYACGLDLEDAPAGEFAVGLCAGGDRSRLMVSSLLGARRRRFAIGHALGHWNNGDCDRLDVRCAETALSAAWQAAGAELDANQYALDLLLPAGRPRTPAALAFDFESVRALAAAYEVPWIPAALRLLEWTARPAVAICFDALGRRLWHRLGPGVLEGVRLGDPPAADTLAGSLLTRLDHGGEPLEVPAEVWLRHPPPGLRLREDSFHAGGAFRLTLLSWPAAASA